MKNSFDNDILTSFYLWLDNRIIKDGEGYSNKPVTLYKQNDPSRLPLISYNSPFKSWVADSCQGSAMIPSGFFSGTVQFNRNSGIHLDFLNGRVLSSGDLGATITGTISKKDYNIYNISEDEATFLLEKIKDSNKNLDYVQTGILNPYKFVAPCIFVTNAAGKNDPFAFGGLNLSKRTIRLYVISDNNYNQEALNGLMIDSAHKTIAILDNTAAPYTAYGDLKSGYYNYCDTRSAYGCASGAYINNVFSYKVDQKSNHSNTLLLSFYDFELEKVRYAT